MGFVPPYDRWDTVKPRDERWRCSTNRSVCSIALSSDRAVATLAFTAALTATRGRNHAATAPVAATPPMMSHITGIIGVCGTWDESPSGAKANLLMGSVSPLWGSGG